MGDEQGRTVETSEGISDQLCIWSSVACDLMGSIKSGGICAFPVSGSLCSGGTIGWSSKVHYGENTYQKEESWRLQRFFSFIYFWQPSFILQEVIW